VFFVGLPAIWGIQRLAGEEIWGDMGEYTLGYAVFSFYNPCFKTA
jgi:hypothetical protein